MKRILATFAALALSASAVLAHDFTTGNLEIHHPASKATLPGQPVGGGFMTITNKGTDPDRLVSITAPDVSDDVQIHEMAIENDVMKMRQLPDGVEIPAGAKVELKSGGLHVMFMKIKHPFKEGDSFKATLNFEKAGAVDVNFKIEAAKPGNAGGGEGAANHEGHGG
ncbi:copper chaperone PCu(A)C [Shinella sp. CPCC 101442]|uniref:copper chaperone PCu(A)C n=1 Tax=Shinella sp. CPCC 101442 TaxID=2932265 RepID=UPI00215379D3|nr:copper chaperone PCu(A)C [Shinella sp. CPCC 101442]MCR6499004.1 copper chaperone PCu(A)C [Shinella sp. CPCC 101442]